MKKQKKILGKLRNRDLADKSIYCVFCQTGSKASDGLGFMLLVIAPLIIFFSAAVCAQGSISLDHIGVDSVDLTAQKFFRSYISKDADERKNAELYLLGVMDATEGKSWCDYRTFKTVTLRERIFEEFKKLDSSRLDERASNIIEDILNQRYPCGGRK